MDQPELIPHLFRTEFRKITAVLCNHFGIQHIETAEDIAGETFLSALENWPYKGVPANPVAWLYTVAKNKAKNQFTRNNIFSEKIKDELQRSATVSAEMEIDLSDKNITDSQLQMLFAVCHPAISIESQIGLALRILCGFGIEEIANALLSNKETINKRLSRAKEKLRQENISMELPAGAAIKQRLESVLTTLYLLFNEGYYSESNDSILREEFCLEAMRLTDLLIGNPATDLPKVNALFALMCFHASRFPARRNDSGGMILYGDQDSALWDKALITKGSYHLHRSSSGNNLSRYHLESGIAYWHTIKEDTGEKWENILQLFNHLLQLAYSPAAALNRTYAFSRVYGKEKAITEAEKLQLTNNHYYFVLLGDLYTGISNDKAKEHFEKAFSMTNSAAEKRSIQGKLNTM